MFTWNHRVIDLSHENDGDPLLGFREVTYNEFGIPDGYNEPFMVSEDIEGLRELVARLQAALDQPIVNGKLILSNEESEVNDGL